MSRCVYKRVKEISCGKPELACVRCGHTRRTFTPPEKIARTCTAPPNPPGACQHRGEARGTSECVTCQGSVKIKLFACALHNCECTIGKVIPRARCCATCEDYSAARLDTADDGRAG